MRSSGPPSTVAADVDRVRSRQPVPEVDPVVAGEFAAVVASGRSDYPNQINDVLVFPGFFRGLLDAGVSDFSDDMLIAAGNGNSGHGRGGGAQPHLHRPQRV